MMAHASPDRKRQRVDALDTSNDNGETGPNLPGALFLAPTARWCSVEHPDADAGHRSGVSWDAEKIKCFLSEEQRNEAALVQSLTDGTDLTFASKLHPLIFDVDSGPESVALRSLPFLRRLVSNSDGALDEYRGWSMDKKRIVALGVRDLYLANTSGLLNEDENGLLAKFVDIIEEPLAGESVVVEGMEVSFYPSASFKTVKFIEDLDSKLDPKWGPYFAQMSEIPRLFTVFVNPAELSFHNFENIVPLDRWMETKLPSVSMESGAPLELTDIQDVHPGQHIWTTKLRGASSQLLKELPRLSLFVAPLNKSTRGGERFIFHSTILSTALTAAISSSTLLPHLADSDPTASDFAFVNYVFRCNRFAPGDAKFTTHRDTPYYDGARSQVSKYTLLIYLSSGKNPDGVLEVNGTTLTDIEEFACVIFDQRHEHEGRPFVDTDKVFLRTELVFNDKGLAKNPKIASLFSEACYMTGQSVLDESLASYAHECFERANSLHWAVEREAAEPPVYLYKQYQGVKFLTNGHDYWFVKGGDRGLDVADCAVVAVLDYLNCKVSDQGPFRALCRSTTIREDIANTEDAFRLMSSRETTPNQQGETTRLGRVEEEVVEGLFKESPSEPFAGRSKPLWEDDEDDKDEDEETNDGCCPLHCWTTFNAWESEEVAKEYRRCRKFTQNKLFGTPLILLGKKMFINEKQIEISGDKVFIHSSDTESEAPRPNFAACWGDTGAEIFVDVGQEVPAPRLLVPPISFHEYEGMGYHMVMDFFRNDWMVQVDYSRTIPVPVVINDVPEELEDEDVGGPFWQKVKELAGDREEELQGSFWTRESDDETTDDEMCSDRLL